MNNEILNNVTRRARRESVSLPPFPSLHTPFSTLPSPFPSLLHCRFLLFFLPSFPLEVGLLNQARRSVEALQAPQRGMGRSPSRNRISCILTLKYDIWWQQY